MKALPNDVEEIRAALEALGYSKGEKFSIYYIFGNRARIGFVETGEEVGIYDFERHTFVD